MSSVDDRIVNMEFNNKQFTQGVNQSKRDLTGLEQTLAKTGKSKGLTDMANAATQASSKFGAMKIAGVTAIATIANKATLMAGNLLKSFTIDPVMQGFKEYQTNLESVQTIMANTGANVRTVNKYLDQLNNYADRTIYNFSEMAKNIGTFTAAGVDLKTATASIKGIANLAALSGSSSQQASTAMYQLSQAIASGKVNLQDWNSVVNAGMGGKVFQTALTRTAEQMGTLEKGSVKLVGPMKKLQVAGQSFRDSVASKPGEQPWMTSEVLVETLKQISGGYTKAQLAAKGYSKQQIKDIQTLQRRAFDAATQIKTLPQLIGVIQESIGSTFSSAFRTIVGDFSQSKKLWGDVGYALLGPGGSITKIQNGFTNLLTGWAKMGGRKDLLKGLAAGFHALGAVVGTFTGAFRDIFPPATSNMLVTMTKNFRSFTEALMPSKSALEDLRTIFGGFFAVLHIGWTVVKALVVGFSAFFGEILKGSGAGAGGLLHFVAGLASLLIKADEFITSGGKLVDIFRNVGKAAGAIAGTGISIATGIIGGIVSGIVGSAGAIQEAVVTVAMSIVNWFKEALGIHSPAQELVPVGTNIVLGVVEGITSAIKALGTAIAGIGSFIKDAFTSLFGGFDAMDFAALMNAVFTGGMILAMKKLVDTVREVTSIKDSFTGVLDELTNTLSVMQTTLKANALMQIAIAVGVLTASLIAMSFIKPEKLAVGLGAIAIMMGELVGALYGLSKINADDLIKIGVSMNLVATSLLVLSGAVAAMGFLPFDVLKQGLGGIGIALGIMTGSLLALSKSQASVLAVGGAMVMMAGAINTLVAAIVILGILPFDKLKQGLGAVAIGIAIMAGALLLLGELGPEILAAGGAMIMMATAMDIMVASVVALGLIPWSVVEQGLKGVAIGIGIMVVALVLLAEIGPGVLAAGGAMIMMAVALNTLVSVLLIMGAAPWAVVEQGLKGMAIALGILLAAALIAAAPPILAGLAALSTVVLAIGAAMALAGAGMLAFGTGFAIFAAAGVAGVAVLIAAFNAFLAMLPNLAVQLAASLVAFLRAIANASPKIRKAMNTIITNMLGTITDALPEIGKLMSALIDTGLGVIEKGIPRYAEAGLKIILGLLDAMEKHVPDIADKATDLAIKFIETMGDNAVKFANAGAEVVVKTINGLAEAVRQHGPEIRAAARNLAEAFVSEIGAALRDLVPNIPIPDIHLPKGVSKVLGAVGFGRMALGKGGARGPRPTEANYIKGIVSFGKAFANQISGVNTAMEGAVRLVTGTESGGAYEAQKAANLAQKTADTTKARAEQQDIAANRAVNAADKRMQKAQAIKDKKKRTAAVKAARKQKTQAARERSRADKTAAAAERQQQIADDKAQKARDEIAFEAADTQGKGDIRSQQGQDLAAKANALLADAQGKAAEAAKLAKGNKKDREQAARLRKQAAAEAKQAAQLAKDAQDAQREAIDLYAKARGEAAQEVTDRMQSIRDDLAAKDADRAWQKQFNDATAEQKISMLDTRAKEMDQKAEAARVAMEAAFAEAEAKKETDAAAAMAALDEAERQAQLASQYADQADQDRQQIEQLQNQGTDTGTGGTGAVITPSRTALEDAALAVDRYTASVAQAEELATAGASSTQFIQNNYSPESLSAGEIYRQSKNLISAAELNLGKGPR